MKAGRALVALAALGSSFAATCGDDRFPIAILAQQEVHAYCAQATRCGQYRDVNLCLVDLDVTSADLSPIIQRALDPAFAAAAAAGTVHYDELAAHDCVDAIAATSCNVATRDARLAPDACTAMFVGQVAEGKPCGFDQECASGRCTPAGTCPDDYSCCLGTCATPPHTVALGGACAIDSDCAVDAFCSGAGCHALIARGESCSSSAQCDFDLICLQPSAFQSGECGPPPALGEPCPDHVCGEIGTTCGSDATCDALGLPSAACATAGDCGPSEVCDPTMHCARPPKLGEPCTNACAPGAWCNPDDGSGTCDAPLPNGSPCGFYDQCASLFCADGDFATTCIDRPVCF